jgi:hypothetical protein
MRGVVDSPAFDGNAKAADIHGFAFHRTIR